jgi:hypothetical protein
MHDPKPSFEFCAFKFLIQWQENECALHRAISTTPTKCDIHEALKHFQVARTFRNVDGRLSSILNSLNQVRNTQNFSSAYEKVELLASDFKTKFGKQNTSAASKLLWLSHRTPFIIYDGRAVKALRHFGHKFDSYTQYSNVWRNEYARFEGLIRNAVEQLPSGRMFMRSCPFSDDELLQMAKEAWFMERVFDTFLWENGGTIYM